jgi:hypothetical protein
MLEDVIIAEVRCLYCGRAFESAEITSEWCAACGRRIPQVILDAVGNRLPSQTPPQAAQPVETDETSLWFAASP